MELVGGVEGGGDEGDVGVARWLVEARGRQPVEPAGVNLSVAHLRTFEQVEQERLVRRPATDDHDQLGQCSSEPGDRLDAVGSEGDDLGDHRVVLRRDDVALGDAGVDTDSWPDGKHECLDPPRSGGEATLWVLGVEARFHGIARRRGHRALEPPAGRDVKLQLDEIESGRQLRDGVFDLQPRVDLEEGEALARRLVQELDGAGVGVAGERRQADSGGAQVGVLLRRQRDAVRLLDHLLVATLQAAITNTGGPHRSVLVGDQLHLDVAGAGDHGLEEHGGVAERVSAFRPGALEGGGELVGLVDAADAAASTTGSGLDHQRVADPFRVVGGVGDRLD